MSKIKKPTSEAEFNLIFLRDLKHRLRMMLKRVEEAERFVDAALMKLKDDQDGLERYGFLSREND